MVSAMQRQPGTNSFSGTLYRSSGPPFNSEPFDTAQVTEAPVGAAAVNFSDVATATLSYTVDRLAQTKLITPQGFGDLPACRLATPESLPATTNYQGLWWASPAGSEAGWGINFAHQGDIIFATWFTYEGDRRPRLVRRPAAAAAGRVVRWRPVRDDGARVLLGAVPPRTG